jgi:hypothetical protein
MEKKTTQRSVEKPSTDAIVDVIFETPKGSRNQFKGSMRLKC